MEAQNKIYNGNFLWMLEALKVINFELNYDKPKLNIGVDEILFYECIVFNENREDSLCGPLSVIHILF